MGLSRQISSPSFVLDACVRVRVALAREGGPWEPFSAGSIGQNTSVLHTAVGGPRQ